MKLTEQGAIDAVLAQEGAGCNVTVMPHGNEGFDLLIQRPDELEERIVEVKGLVADWGVDGVGLTVPEMRAAAEYGDRYWLYVVEYARDPTTATISRIQDPAGRTTEFRFDHGWRAVASDAMNVCLEPAPGRGLAQLDGSPIGVIVTATPRGVAIWLEVTCPGGEVRKLTFNTSEHLVLPAEA